MIDKPYAWAMFVWALVMLVASVYQFLMGNMLYAVIDFFFFVGSVLLAYNNFYIAEI